MSSWNWDALFVRKDRLPGASEDAIREAECRVRVPLTQDEIDRINSSQLNPFPVDHPMHQDYQPFDPREWTLPSRPFPPSYVDLLKWSNGGDLANSRLELFPLFACEDLRDWMIAYAVPLSMPGALPIALNGGGALYMIDMRQEPNPLGEYPVLLTHAGTQDFDEAESFGNSLWEAVTVS